MIASDFEYDGEYLKDWGYIICETNSSSGFETIDSDSQLTFDTISQMNGKLKELTTSYYDDHIEITFQICKYSCTENITPITTYESRELKRWLNRPEFHRFKLIQPNWADIYMEGSFNIKNIEFKGQVYALELTFISNCPFALHEPVVYRFQSSIEENSFSFFDISDEIGYIYPDVEILCIEDGDLEINNSLENRKTLIKNCKKNEVINFTKELLFYSSDSDHKIQNDFNYIFLRIANLYGNRKNILTFSMPVKITLKYIPYVKAVM